VPDVHKDWTALPQTLEGHSRPVSTVAFSMDGKRVASGSYDGTVRIWDIGTGMLQQILEGHKDTVNTIAFSMDGKRVVSGSDDHMMRIWDADTSTLQQTMKRNNYSFNSVAFSMDGKWVVSGSSDGMVCIWDAGMRTLQQAFKRQSSCIWAVTFSPDGKQVETNHGILNLNSSESNPTSSHVESASKIQINNNWVFVNRQRILWLPPDLRPICSVVQGYNIAIGCSSARVFFIKLNI
jgi:WD40 repeat protein